MSFSGKILLGLVAGIAVGAFLGELVSPLDLVASAFVKLLQMMVLPYMTLSIISGLGSLSYREAKILGIRAGAVLGLIWVVALTYACLFPLAFPKVETASFFSTNLVEPSPSFDFIDLFIPANPFHSLANNIVPAVVIFSVFLGVAMIGAERKQVLLDVLAVASRAVARATRIVVRLTPYGIFAIAAVAAGTLNVEQIAQIEVYLVTYVVMALLMALWVLPGLVASFTPIRYRDVLRPTRDALITAFMVGDLFIVLPILIESCRELLESRAMTDEHSRALPDIVIPTSFNFPHAGKLLSLSFILFAGWLEGSALPATDYPRLALAGLVSFFGSLSVAVPFLLDQFRIPADTFRLFLATGVINSRFGALVAAVHTVVVALLASAAIVGALRFEARRILRYAAVTMLLTFATVGGLRLVFETILQPSFHGSETVYGMEPMVPSPTPQILEEIPAEAGYDVSQGVLEGIRARGALRVGVLRDRIPYAYKNKGGRLVGFDIDVANLLARDLEVPVKFVPLEAGSLPRTLNHGAVDIVMSGFAVSPDRAAAMLLSAPYLDETLAFLVRDNLRSSFATWDDIRALGATRIGVVNVPYFIARIRERLPEADLNIIQESDKLLQVMEQSDVIAYSAERGAVQTLLNPKFAVVVPQPDVVKIPLVYPLARRDRDWGSFIDTWIELRRRDGTIDALYRHWILGQTASRRVPRWSIIRDVLGWVH